MLQLNHIDLATKEDVQNNLVYWAKLFNATTWEEFKALAEMKARNAEMEAKIARLTAELSKYNNE